MWAFCSGLLYPCSLLTVASSLPHTNTTTHYHIPHSFSLHISTCLLYSKSSRNTCSVRFILGDVHMRAMHYAVDQLDIDVLYSTPTITPAANPPGIKRCLDDLAKLELYEKQKNAIRGMLESSYKKVS